MVTRAGALTGEASAPPPASTAPGLFEHTAVGGGYVRVLVDGIEVSKHTMQHKAAQEAEKQKRANPTAHVVYRPEYEIEVTEIK